MGFPKAGLCLSVCSQTQKEGRGEGRAKSQKKKDKDRKEKEGEGKKKQEGKGSIARDHGRHLGHQAEGRMWALETWKDRPTLCAGKSRSPLSQASLPPHSSGSRSYLRCSLCSGERAAMLHFPSFTDNLSKLSKNSLATDHLFCGVF